ncbi:hypothetical protein NEHOM01_1598 [Nematocida homosporus]|uniref:uncharacterized protein n=1 Tax=Nematocida homosporus TaxID=1912981 RepID=UPI00221FDECA|nr:uncharacterized protein NEHOM01_1598 [Nematocida homosporus]KAI5186630.1 hypothetical protein NEHOM01_1598 [Nematocida homosporus]
MTSTSELPLQQPNTSVDSQATLPSDSPLNKYTRFDAAKIIRTGYGHTRTILTNTQDYNYQRQTQFITILNSNNNSYPSPAEKPKWPIIHRIRRYFRYIPLDERDPAPDFQAHVQEILMDGWQIIAAYIWPFAKAALLFIPSLLFIKTAFYMHIYQISTDLHFDYNYSYALNPGEQTMFGLITVFAIVLAVIISIYGFFSNGVNKSGKNALFRKPGTLGDEASANSVMGIIFYFTIALSIIPVVLNLLGKVCFALFQIFEIPVILVSILVICAMFMIGSSYGMARKFSFGSRPLRVILYIALVGTIILLTVYFSLHIIGQWNSCHVTPGFFNHTLELLRKTQTIDRKQLSDLLTVKLNEKSDNLHRLFSGVTSAPLPTSIADKTIVSDDIFTKFGY